MIHDARDIPAEPHIVNISESIETVGSSASARKDDRRKSIVRR